MKRMTLKYNIIGFRLTHGGRQAPSLKELRRQLELLRQGAEEAHQELTEGLTRGAEAWIVDVKDALMTKDMQEAMSTVSFLLDNVKKFDKEAKSYEGFGFLLLALVKKAHDSSEHLQWEENLVQHEGNLSSLQLEAARRVGQFAIDVYPASWKLNLPGIGKCLGVSEEDIVLVHFTDKPNEGHCPKFALFLDHSTRSLVLAIRGTFCVKDIVLDIVCEDVPFLDGHAHSGILTGARRILERAGHLITASLMLHPGYALTLTGHSLGAGTAELLTMDFLEGEAGKLLPHGTKVDKARPPISQCTN